MEWRNINIRRHDGFTLLEVMVALAIMGVAVAIFFNLIGNSSRLRGRIDEHTDMLILARTKTDEAFLGILGEPNTKVNEKSIFEGTTKEGVKWRVSAVDKIDYSQEESTTDDVEKLEKMQKTSKDKREEEGNVPLIRKTMLNTQVSGISIDTIILSTQSNQPAEFKKSDQSKQSEKSPTVDVNRGDDDSSE